MKKKPSILERMSRLPLELQLVFLDDLETACDNRLLVFENMTQKIKLLECPT